MVEIKKKEKKKNKKKEKKQWKVAEKARPEITAEEDNGDKEKKSLKIDNGQIETAQRQQENTSNKKRKRKEVFPYGNYKNYYGYRIGKEMKEDPRLMVLKREWFQGKDCLDIGCNSGIVTIRIAKKFHCRSMRGIDIDNNLIQEAYWNLRKIVRKENSGKINIKSSTSGVLGKENCSEQKETASLIRQKEIASNGMLPGRELSEIVSFQKENFVDSPCPPKEHYDTILCLSVTKWIHLNWGDDGLLTLFSKIWTLLRPGGILVLEPQPWRSYESKHLVSETAALNYRAIMFRPECFQEILLDKIGFRMVEDITSGLSGSKTGFDRPIFAFRK